MRYHVGGADCDLRPLELLDSRRQKTVWREKQHLPLTTLSFFPCLVFVLVACLPACLVLLSSAFATSPVSHISCAEQWRQSGGDKVLCLKFIYIHIIIPYFFFHTSSALPLLLHLLFGRNRIWIGVRRNEWKWKVNRHLKFSSILYWLQLRYRRSPAPPRCNRIDGWIWWAFLS